MTITQEYHQISRYGVYNNNNHEKAIGGGTPIYKQQDYINNEPNVIPSRMTNKEKLQEQRKIIQRKKEGHPLIVDNPFN